MRTLLGGILIGLMLSVLLSVLPARAQEDERLAPEEQEVKEAKAEEKAGEESWIPGHFAGNVAFYTDYSFRGVSQTGKQFAFQGGLDWTHETGFFLGLWDSTVHFGDAYLESDWYGGYAGAVNDFTYAAQAVWYYYPSNQSANYWEFIGKLGYNFGPASVNTGLVGSPDYFGTLGTGFYIPFGVAAPLPLPEDWTRYFTAAVDGNAGYTHADKVIFTKQHYWDWNLGVVVSLPVHINLDFRYVDTSNTEGFGDADARFVFGAKYLF